MDKIKRWKLLEGSTGVHDNNGSFVEFTDHQAALDEVLKEAVWAMEIAKDAMECGVAPGDLTYDIDHKRVRDFLSRPDVQAWRARQKEQG